ncbi:replication protein A 70 kDa DNA-binding subunit A-like [Senna tora]|uniref:Replication protein A 70 kDa DNA-binding subunit A-like n=1 Tax=Senna tora TaxID=362788 RepID=A0A834W432_9FABA|nr:replication protein A 70 kDa DNA-binding subunit A-like [Senna tora]
MVQDKGLSRLLLVSYLQLFLALIQTRDDITTHARNAPKKLFLMGVKFLGSSATELLQGLVADFGDTSSVPDRLDDFLGKKFLFKLKIKDDRFSYFNPKYIVMRMSDRESLIEQYNRNKDDIQQSPCSNTTPVLSEFDKESGTIDLEASGDHCITPVKRTSAAYYDDSSPSIIQIPSETSSNKYRKIIEEEDQ